jgi:hypothetical protein
MGDSVPKHTGPISSTDTHPRTEHLQNPTVHHPRKPQRWKAWHEPLMSWVVFQPAALWPITVPAMQRNITRANMRVSIAGVYRSLSDFNRLGDGDT